MKTTIMDTFQDVIHRHLPKKVATALDILCVRAMLDIKLLSETANSALTLLKAVDEDAESSASSDLRTKLRNEKKEVLKNVREAAISLGVPVESVDKLEVALKADLAHFEIRRP